MPEKDQIRKIQFTGKSSFIVSLPKDWIRDQGIKQGDQVSVARQGSSIIQIKPLNFSKSSSNDSATLLVSSKDDKYTITRKLISLYFLHYKTINVRPKTDRIDPNQRMKNYGARLYNYRIIIIPSTNKENLQVLYHMNELVFITKLKL